MNHKKKKRSIIKLLPTPFDIIEKKYGTYNDVIKDFVSTLYIKSLLYT